MTTKPTEEEASTDVDPPARCYMCLDVRPPLTHPGCACKNGNGVVHLECLARYAEVKQPPGKAILTCRQCKLCHQGFTGEVRLGVARKLCQRTEHLAEGDGKRLAARYLLAFALCFDEGMFEEAAAVQPELVAVWEREAGKDDPKTIFATAFLAEILFRLGDYVDSDKMIRWALAGQKQAVGVFSQTTILSWESVLADVLFKQKKYAEAELLYRKLVNELQSLHGNDDTDKTLLEEENRLVLSLQGKRAEAETLVRKLWEVQKKKLGVGHPDVHDLGLNLSRALLFLSKLDDAEEVARQVMVVQGRSLGDDCPAAEIIDYIRGRKVELAHAA